MTSDKNLKIMVYYSIVIAFIIVWGMTIGYIPLFAAITLTHIPVIIAAMSFDSAKGAALFGTMFGITSLIRCFTSPDVFAAVVLNTGGSFTFKNVGLIILLIIIPRILAALASYFVFLIFRKITEKQSVQTVGAGISAAVGSLTNTVLFLGGFYIFAGKDLAARAFELGYMPEETIKALLAVLIGVASTNGLMEMAAAIVVCTPAVIFLRKFLHRAGVISSPTDTLKLENS